MSTITVLSPAAPTLAPKDAPESTTHFDSACVLDCPDACSLQVTVTDGRVAKVDAGARNPVTQGFICSKVRAFPKHLYGDERLLYPARRRGERGRGDFERISWDEAFDLIAERLRDARRAHGGESILPFCYGGSNGLLSQGATDQRLFRRLGASRLAHTVCAAAAGRAAHGLYGKMAGVAYEDYRHADLIIVWGANPSVSSIHMVPLIREAQSRGATLVVIDPRRIPLAKQADIHLPLRPGTDLPVALAIHRWLFENDGADLEFLAAHTTGAGELRRRAEPWTIERAARVAGVDATALEDVARRFAAARPAVIRCGWGPERNRNGGSATCAILALPAVAGKFGVPGGGFTLSNGGAWNIDGNTAVAAEEKTTRLVNMNRLGKVLTGGREAGDTPVQVLFVYNCNPLMTLPDQERVRAGLERDDLFTVVFDQVMTDTALYADLILPATTFLEHHDLRTGYGAMVMQENRPVIAPVGEARSNFEVFAELLRRLGLDEDGDADTPEAFRRAIFDARPDGDKLRAALDRDGLAEPATGQRPVQMVDVLPQTPDGKIHLVPDTLDREAPHGLYHYQEDPATRDYPLALISPATHRTISSTFGQLYTKGAALELSPVDAETRGLRSGDSVRVWNDLGEVRCRVRVTEDQRPGVAFLPKGLWARNTDNGSTSNALVPDTYTDLADGACFNDARVEVEAVA